MACLGPVTKAGCGALCPRHARGCYGCFGPAENANVAALASHFRDMGMCEEAIWQQFMLIYSHEKILANSFGGGHDQPH